VDATGVGRAVIDLLRREKPPCRLVPVVITFGHAITWGDDGARHLPKKELVGTLQVLLQNRRLKISSRLPEAAVLKKELENFRVKITAAANETFGAGPVREGPHDDLVLALALACWEAEQPAGCFAPVAVEPEEPMWGTDAVGHSPWFGGWQR
jgi:hypothetical protein